MKVVIQRAKRASVEIIPSIGESYISGSINNGIVVFVGIAADDFEPDLDFMVNKILNLRLIPTDDPKRLKSISEAEGDILLVSQFTLYSEYKGNKLDYHNACEPQKAEKLFEFFCEKMKNKFAGKIERGVFGAHMEVSLVNDGPHTTILESRIPIDFPENLSRLGTNLQSLKRRYEKEFNT